MIFVWFKFNPAFPCLNLNILPFNHYFVSLTTGKYGVSFKYHSRWILIHTWKSQTFCTGMSTAIIHDSQKNYALKCPSKVECECISKLWYIHEMKHHTIESNNMDESQKHILNDRSQTQRLYVPFTWNSRTGKSNL